MDFSAILSLFLGIIIIVYGIVSEGSISSFISLSSVAITAGGAFVAIGISFNFTELKGIPKHFKLMLRPQKYKINECIQRLSSLAFIARKEGMLALENALTDKDDEFLRSSILLIVDSVEPSKARDIFEKQLDYMAIRHENVWTIYQKAAAYGPAFGMIGTIIGLINMLNSMSMDGGSEALASGMAVALITTFYGTIMANLIFTPMATRLQTLHNQEVMCKELIIEGVLAIQDGANPKFVEERLCSFSAQQLNPKKDKNKKKGKKKG